MSQPLPIDKERFRLTAETPEETQEVLTVFFKVSEQKLSDMENACSSKDWDAWKSAAHYMKSGAGNLGMNALAEACRTAELGNDFSDTQSSIMLKAIRSELQLVREFFGHWAKPV